MVSCDVTKRTGSNPHEGKETKKVFGLLLLSTITQIRHPKGKKRRESFGFQGA